MRFELYLCMIFISASADAKENKQGLKCIGVEVRGKFHRADILARGLNRPYQLSYYKHKREIYFSYNIGSDEEDKFEIGYIEENSTEHKTIPSVQNGFATAIDGANNIAFFGGSEGVYLKHLGAGKNEISQIIKGYNIWNLYFRNHLYFITYPSLQLYKYTHNTKKHNKPDKPEHQKWIHEKIYQFAIDQDEDIFITNITGLYMIKKGSQQRHLIHGATVFRAIETNNQGDVYFCGQNAIYVPIKHNQTLHKIADIKNVFGLTFDHDDYLIYSNSHQIVRLPPFGCKIEADLPYVPIPIPT